ncbi:Protein of unknown function (DUF3034) [Alteromonadaceae bacterium 2753L.S.0a.02]|nr:Protein of unknown function (DUF3034) [Alteromonadaceae bacterium 2753L.S.0a.02]
MIFLVSTFAGDVYAGGKLLATPGVAQIEGAGGGGLVPWAQLAGYASESQVGVSGFCSRATINDYALNVCGAQLNVFNRMELSYARQTFDVPAFDTEISQQIAAVKIRLYGDIVYSRWPQISAGVQRKKLQDSDIAFAVGALRDSGNDYYLAASKLHLAALAGYNLFWNLSIRHTEANQLGLLGFGGPEQSTAFQVEGSTALFLSSHLAFGYEYRQKPDNLGLGEQAWQDVFIAWFPTKYLNLTVAYLDLGSIAGAPDQTGWYLSVMGNL